VFFFVCVFFFSVIFNLVNPRFYYHNVSTRAYAKILRIDINIEFIIYY
jgi:hypothetical protein